MDRHLIKTFVQCFFSVWLLDVFLTSVNVVQCLTKSKLFFFLVLTSGLSTSAKFKSFINGVFDCQLPKGSLDLIGTEINKNVWNSSLSSWFFFFFFGLKFLIILGVKDSSGLFKKNYITVNCCAWMIHVGLRNREE